MKILNLIILLLFLSSCSNWIYKEVEYESCKNLEKLHVHFYDHNTCEWSCLVMDEGIYCKEDTLRLNVKENKIGKITKIKLIK